MWYFHTHGNLHLNLENLHLEAAGWRCRLPAALTIYLVYICIYILLVLPLIPNYRPFPTPLYLAHGTISILRTCGSDSTADPHKVCWHAEACQLSLYITIFAWQWYSFSGMSIITMHIWYPLITKNDCQLDGVGSPRSHLTSWIGVVFNIGT